MGHERVELYEIIGVRRLRRWRSGGLHKHTEVYVELGRMPEGDDRWWARHTGKGKAYLFGFERDACEKVDAWLTRGEWHPIPAVFGPDGLPADGRVWKVHGQTWIPG